MGLHREIEGAQPLPAERVPGRREPRPAASPWHLATGTLACSACDAPVLPAPGGMAPRDPIACGFCGHAGRVRDFLSLTKPTRPTRVTVRVRGFALR